MKEEGVKGRAHTFLLAALYIMHLYLSVCLLQLILCIFISPYVLFFFFLFHNIVFLSHVDVLCVPEENPPVPICRLYLMGHKLTWLLRLPFRPFRLLCLTVVPTFHYTYLYIIYMNWMNISLVPAVLGLRAKRCFYIAMFIPILLSCPSAILAVHLCENKGGCLFFQSSVWIWTFEDAVCFQYPSFLPPFLPFPFYAII